MTEALFDMPAVILDEPRYSKAVFPEIEVAEERILFAYNSATEPERVNGGAWYQDAHDMCEQWVVDYDMPSLEHVVGIVAALSPRKRWADNVDSARSIMVTGDCGGLGWAKRDAQAIRAGQSPKEVLFHEAKNNTKVQSFFWNILEPQNPDHVTIDRHMISLITDQRWSDRRNRWIRPADHQWARERFQALAVQLGLVPNQLQAITWVVWRRSLGIVEIENTGQMSLFEGTAA